MADVPQRLAEALKDRYTLVREVGAGGMATVYLAEDPRHHRQVALKVLRPDLAASLGPERFLREVTIAANLQHPHILPVYDSGEADGFLYYVMPYVEGESLRDRLARHGELPVADAVRILRDVADAMAAAHEKGVVHRDIKPENVMLSGRHALVTDFGVAKAVSEATGRLQLTTAGVALGTPAYMAPEQAVADPLMDHRADLYAFGVTAYEVLTGQPPFVGPTPQAVLAAHVTEMPVPVTQRRASIPAPLAELVMRCLEKKPADRPQRAEELLPVLEALATPSGGVTPAQTRPVRAASRSRRMITVAAVAAGAVLVAVVLRAAGVLGARPLDITISGITAVTSQPGVEFQPALAPDGSEVAFVAGSIVAPHLAVRSTINVASGGEVRLADTSFRWEYSPTWSADGESVRFLGCRPEGCDWNETGKLGGTVRPVTVPPRAQALAWSPDGAEVAFVSADSILVADAQGRNPRLVAVHTDRYWSLHSLAWSPDGRRIAYVNGNPAWRWGGNVAPSSVWVVAARGGAPVQVAGGNFLTVSPAWLDDGHLLFVSNRDGARGVYVVPLGSRGPTGAPRAIPGVADPHGISYSPRSHKLAYAKLTLRQNLRAYPLTPTTATPLGAGRPITTGSQVVEVSDVSPDGRWIAYDGNLRGNMDLYKVPLTGGEAVLLTDAPGDEFHPRWSPDGSEIAFYDSRDETVVMPARGGPARDTVGPGLGQYPEWSPDGRHLAFVSTRTGPVEVWMTSRDSVGAPWHDAVQLSDFGCFLSDWTPDGSGVLCVRPGNRELAIVSLDRAVRWRYDLAGNRLTVLSGNTGRGVRYSRDGSTLFFPAVHADGRRGIWAMPAAGGPARLVVDAADPSLVMLAGPLSVGPQALYVAVSEYESDIWVVTLGH